MLKEAMELLAIVAGLFAAVIWVWTILYYIDMGITFMFIRLTTSAIVLTAVSIYCFKDIKD